MAKPRREYPPRNSKKPLPDGTSLYVRYGPEVANEICDRLAAGEVWHRFANTGRMPSYDTLHKWMRKYPDFAEAVAQAREVAGEYAADRAQEVVEESTHETVQSDRLRVSHYHWRAAKAAPHLYGSSEERAAFRERRIPVRVLDFEKVEGPDGKIIVRPIYPREYEA